MKAATACLRKLTSAVRASGAVGEPRSVAQLDDMVDISVEVSPGYDPPVGAAAADLLQELQMCVVVVVVNNVSLWLFVSVLMTWSSVSTPPWTTAEWKTT